MMTCPCFMTMLCKGGINPMIQGAKASSSETIAGKIGSLQVNKKDAMVIMAYFWFAKPFASFMHQPAICWKISFCAKL